MDYHQSKGMQSYYMKIMLHALYRLKRVILKEIKPYIVHQSSFIYMTLKEWWSWYSPNTFKW